MEETTAGELTFANIVDLFKEEDFPKNSEGFTEVPAEAIYLALQQLFPYGYKEDVHEGFYPDGRAYVRYGITVADPNGGQFYASVYGYAEANPGQEMSLAGLLTMARRQAVLRGLHMGHSMYKKAAEAETTARPRTTPPASVSGSVTLSPRTGRAFGARPSRTFAADGSDWNGEAKIKKAGSPYEGKRWADLPIEVIQKWASGANPFQLAVWELNRREREAKTVDAAVEAATDAALDAAISSTGTETAPTPSAAATVARSSFSFRR